MGYDFTIEIIPEDEAARAAEAEAAFYAAAKQRDTLGLPREHPEFVAAQAAVDRAYDAMADADPSSFRLNIWGMSRYSAIMDQLGMVVNDYSIPPFPHRPEGVPHEEIDAFAEREPGSGLPARPEVAAYWKQFMAHLSWHPEPTFGIALHKFGSNDGWLVTPEEIAAALESYRTHGSGEVKVIVGDDIDYWLKWIAYLERAQHRGGFRVW